MTVILFGGLCLLAGMAMWMATRSWFIIAVVSPSLEDSLGGDIEIERATYHGEGRLLFRDIRLLAPDVQGKAGEICHIGRAYVQIDMGRLLRGKLRVYDIVFDDMLLRLSEQRRRPGSFNVMALSPEPPGDDSTSEILPPRLQITNAVVEVGVHGEAGDYELFGRRALTGALVPTGEEGVFGFTLVEVDERGEVLPQQGIVVQGEWNVHENDHSFRVSDVALDARTYGMCPQIARLWWERMELGGRVHSVDVRWTAEDDFQIEFEIEDVGLTLPIKTDNLWARYRGGEVVPSQGQPRMQVNRGTILIVPDEIVLNDMHGELVSSSADSDVVGLPYRVTFRLHDLPRPDWENRQQWMDDVLATAPFEAALVMDEFRVQRSDDGDPIPVELPMAVARLLERFRLSDWRLSSTIDVSRGAPRIDDEGATVTQPIRSRGRAVLADAAGTYERFRYPLQDIWAEISFDHEQVLLHELRAVGSDGAVVRGEGVIAPPDMSPGVSLDLTARNVPLDQALRDALPESQQRLFDALMNETALEGLKAAGFAPGESELGGTIDLQLHIEREPGRHQPTFTTGAIDVGASRMLYEPFPYPLEVEGGRLRWGRDRIAVLGDGITFTTPCGGQGSLVGEIRMPRQDGRTLIQPDLHINIHDDAVCPALLAAVPGGAEGQADGAADAAADAPAPGREGYSPVASWLDKIDLSGTLDYHVHVGTDPDGSPSFTADVALAEATAEGWPALKDALARGELDAKGASQWRLENCSAFLRITPDFVDIRQLSGRCPNGRLNVTGRAQLGAAASMHFDVEMQGLPVNDDLIDLFGEHVPEQVRSLWDRYDPQGAVDASVEYARESGQLQPPKLTFHPRTVSLRMGDTPLSLQCTDGAIRIDEEGVVLDGLSLALEADDGAQGVMALAGDWQPSGAESDGGLYVSGGWKDARLESALIPELLDAFAAPEQVEHFLSLRPHGRFDAEFSFQSRHGEAGETTYRLRVLPLTVSLTMREQALAWDVQEGAEVVFTPGRIDLGPTTAETESGRFTLRGHVETDAPARILLHIDQQAPLTQPPLSAILPDTVGAVLTALEFEDGSVTSVQSGVLELNHVSLEDGSNDWIVNFGGRLVLNGASFKAGLGFTDATGPLDLRFQRRPDRALSLDVQVQLERARVMGQDLRDVQANVTMSDAGDQVLLSDLRAEAGDGAVSVEAAVGVGERDDYTVAARLTGVPVSDFVVRDPQVNEQAAPAGDPPDRPVVSGQLYASVDLSGRRDRPEQRVGRGVARVLEGRLADIPLTLQLLQLMQLTIPPEGLDYADAEFYIAGDRAVFERILFEGTIGQTAALQLLGRGEMNLETFELDARFRSRSGLAIIRDIVGEIGDQLAVLEVTGPLWSPSARLVALPAMSRTGDSASSAAPLVLGEEPRGE